MVLFTYKYNTLKNSILIISLLLLLVSCKTASYGKLHKVVASKFNPQAASNHFRGLMVFDSETKDTLYNYNGSRYFIPASNVKIFTLFAALETLPPSIPALRYSIQKDTVYVQGTGDPSALHPHFNDSTLLKFLTKFRHIALNQSNFYETAYGPGWAWEDYEYYFSPERSGLPLFGNVVTITKNADTVWAEPSVFKNHVTLGESPVNRDVRKNFFYFDPKRNDTLTVPYLTSRTLTKQLLETKLKKKIYTVDSIPNNGKKDLLGMPSDSLYTFMMHQSDNFIAEQLLLLVSSTLSDSLNSKKARTFILEHKLAHLRQPPRWVDGSGLSRYNLFSPESFVTVLHEMLRKIPEERLFRFFPAGGIDGTLKGRFKGGETPYIYAKSGSLGNTYNLSGYLKSKKGKILVFSYMNNHYRKPSAEIRAEMSDVLCFIRLE